MRPSKFITSSIRLMSAAVQAAIWAKVVTPCALSSFSLTGPIPISRRRLSGLPTAGLAAAGAAFLAAAGLGAAELFAAEAVEAAGLLAAGLAAAGFGAADLAAAA